MVKHTKTKGVSDSRVAVHMHMRREFPDVYKAMNKGEIDKDEAEYLTRHHILRKYGDSPIWYDAYTKKKGIYGKGYSKR